MRIAPHTVKHYYNTIVKTEVPEALMRCCLRNQVHGERQKKQTNITGGEVYQRNSPMSDAYCPAHNKTLKPEVPEAHIYVLLSCGVCSEKLSVWRTAEETREYLTGGKT